MSKKKVGVDFTNVLINNVFCMHIRLDYFYFSAFNLEVKETEILKYILLFSGKKHGDKLPNIRKILVAKIVLLRVIEK